MKSVKSFLTSAFSLIFYWAIDLRPSQTTTKLQKMQLSSIHITPFFYKCNNFFHSFYMDSAFHSNFLLKIFAVSCVVCKLHPMANAKSSTTAFVCNYFDYLFGCKRGSTRWYNIVCVSIFLLLLCWRKFLNIIASVLICVREQGNGSRTADKICNKILIEGID